jgi:2-methylisocitrate lyase-like PEP mutase family enzyme
MNYNSRETLSGMLKRNEPFVAPGAHNAIAARVVENLGFPCVYIGGWMTGAQLVTTEPLTTLTEQVEAASWLVRATQIPVICDAGAGFGDPVHTARTVREFEYRGIAGIHIEDQVFPKRLHYHKGIEHVTERHEFEWKLTAALGARQDPNFVIIARTDARNAVGGNFDEAVERGRMAKSLGADAVMPMLHSHTEEMEAYRDAVPDIPLVHLTGFGGGISPELCHSRGFNIVLMPLTSILAEVAAISEVYGSLVKDGVVPDHEKYTNARTLIEELVDFKGLYEVEARTTEGAAASSH